MNRLLFSTVLLAASVSANAQLGKIPVSVTAAFAKQYPAAKQIAYDDNLTEYRVHFADDSSKMTARYNAKGEWRGSERPIDTTRISAEVIDGLKKSKYADWKILSAALLYLPEKNGGGEQYRILVARNEIDKKYLYFNRTGRLVRDTRTL
jgi:hypothetical protein